VLLSALIHRLFSVLPRLYTKGVTTTYEGDNGSVISQTSQTTALLLQEPTMAATAAANSMAHQLPPSMAVPAMPRIRPPRMMKGDPHPNNAPRPDKRDPPRSGYKWVQGKWRLRTSSAVRSRTAVLEAQAVKAFRLKRHGIDIYAYRHIRTNQVVYSLSRILQVRTNMLRVQGLC
jgi:hypothetical protein